ncbi:hypothetical protein Nepgr_001665 [Nepenthes gracilis]|uniref:Prenylcysteine lyase domain-containing protein n=1 Tax=Nepenthes gracilis TaxID=150966 RepID=A0AAD3RXP0_NEPGR|nr:hypothetical protein Nepgr_001665 [Nepenthes gracilis]
MHTLADYRTILLLLVRHVTVVTNLGPCFLLLISPSPLHHSSPPPATVCIVGSGIAGSSLAHFLRRYSAHPSRIGTIRIFERNGVVGGRMATVTVANEIFEAGASILHPKNYHALNFTNLLNLKEKTKTDNDDLISLGIWDGSKFVFKTLSVDSKFPFIQKVVAQINSLRLLWRYGASLFKMESYVESTLDKFLKYYESFDSRPFFATVEEMLEWSGLRNLPARTLQEELIDAGLSALLIEELVTVITRINYGQSVTMSGLAGSIALAGSGGNLWAVEGGNWQMAAGLINISRVALHLHEEIETISNLGESYELNSTKGNSYSCEVAVVATPLDELNIQFTPPISIPERKLQHTHTTFIRGLLNPIYFGLKAISEIPELVGTLEDPNIPFSSISVLKKHMENDMTYKIFSREPLADALLDKIFRVRQETIRIDWGAYPHYKAPETFAPFILDRLHLYYVNAFESAASAMETGAVAAENIARLILSRLSGDPQSSLSTMKNSSAAADSAGLHVDL